MTGRRVVLWCCALALAVAGCHPPRAPLAPPGELTTFNPPNIEVLRSGRLRTPPASLVLATPLADGVAIVPRIGHASDVLSVDLRADGELGVSSSRDGTVKVWDLRSGALLGTITEAGVVTAVVILADGRRVLTAGRDGRVRVWALATRQLLRTIGTDTSEGLPITAVAVASSGRRLVVAHGAGGGTLTVYDLDTGQRLRSAATTARVGTLSFTIDGDEVLSGDDSGSLKRYDVATLELERTIAGHAREITALATSADGRRVLSASADGLLKLWDVASGALLSVVPAHSRPVRGVAVSKDAKRAVSASEDGTVKLWDLEEKRALVTMGGHEGAVTALNAAEGDEGILTGGADGTVRLWDFAAEEAIVVLPARDDTAVHASFSASGRSALTVSTGGEMRLWDLSALAVSRQWSAGPGLTVATMSPDASEALSASTEGRGAQVLRLWDIAAGRPVFSFDVRSGGITAATFSPQGQRALTGSMLGSVQLWGTAIRRPLRQFVGHTSPVRSVAISDDGRRGLTSAVAPMVGPDRVTLWDLDTGEELSSFEGYAVGVLAAGGTQAFVGSRDGSLAELDLESRTVTRSWSGHNRAVRAIAADPRGRVIASGDEGGVVKLWDNNRERLLRTLHGHTAAVHTLSFSEDGLRVMSASDDGTLRLWRVDNGAGVVVVAHDEEWLVFGEDGFYAASSRGAELAYAVSGLRGFRLDQLSLAHHRPDLLLERVGGGSPALMEELAARHRRRLREMGTTEQVLAQTFGAAPRVAITELEQRGRRVTVRFRVASERGSARYQVFLNGVPLFGAPKVASGAEIAEAFTVGAGRTHLEIEVDDAAGGRAIPASQIVHYDGPKRRGSLHFIGIGVSSYKRAGLGLKYAARDAVELGRTLASSKGVYRDVHVHTLTDRAATQQALLELSLALNGASVDDTVVLFVAGQWAHTHTSPADPVFLPYDADPARLVGTTTRAQTLAGLIASAPPRRRLMIVDGCVSGDRDLLNLQSSLGEAARRGLSPRTSQVLQLSPQMAPRPFLFSDQRLLSGDRINDSGVVVLRASRGAELCYELTESKSGALTAAVSRALATADADRDGDGWVNLDELQGFVGAAVANLTGGLQHPVMIRGGVEQDIRLPRLHEVIAPSTKVAHPLRVRPPPGCGCGVAAGDDVPRGLARTLLVLALALIGRRAFAATPTTTGERR